MLVKKLIIEVFASSLYTDQLSLFLISAGVNAHYSWQIKATKCPGTSFYRVAFDHFLFQQSDYYHFDHSKSFCFLVSCSVEKTRTRF